MIADYVAIDLETTGLSFKKDRIIEVGAVKVAGGRIVDTFERFVNSGRLLSETVKELTGINEEMLAGAPDASEVIPALLEFVGGDVLVGHRILFDYSFIKREAVNRNLPFEKEGIDTLLLARKFLPELESRRLGDLCRYYGISHRAHRALGDAKAASELYLKLAELFYNEKDFQPRKLICQVKKEGPASKAQIERLNKLAQKHNIVLELECDTGRLTKNEASRITDQILAKYGRG